MGYTLVVTCHTSAALGHTSDILAGLYILAQRSEEVQNPGALLVKLPSVLPGKKAIPSKTS